jgi:hypothetical protein
LFVLCGVVVVVAVAVAVAVAAAAAAVAAAADFAAASFSLKPEPLFSSGGVRFVLSAKVVAVVSE